MNSVNPTWPELALPAVHSNIGGGYLPVVKENLLLTRPETDNAPLHQVSIQICGYHQAVKQMAVLDSYPCISAVLRGFGGKWAYGDRVPANRYGELQKRSFAAITLGGRIVKNDWSKVALRIMLGAAQQAGVMFD
ncbi:hypothetical protein BN439_pEA290002 (plasmid) [Erwinia amylovora Ea644]|uniref:hypothetical protein n=1 Tax=Erwinia amylovora TaxID=552 RepID=UPI0002C6233D|nr:hypothetical protein [Erwinia amylovora]CCP01068.1 hypothetical protein BN439_pEA290002 [Erwinia amylovora Ea644]CCP05029.1 hypothetical protein BN440_pEA290002 [Erwinia amylovora MR1]